MRNEPAIRNDQGGIMRTVPLLPAGALPVVGLGTWQLQGDACRTVVAQALRDGYRHIDTAEMYGNEEEVGQAIKDAEVPREKLFVTSKAWRDHLQEEGVVQACEQSLERLGTYYLDLYLIHWPNGDIPLGETFKGLKRLFDEGKIKAVGVSNFTKERLEAALLAADQQGLKIAVNQVEFHPFLNQQVLLDYCVESGVQLVGYSPLARGGVLGNDVLRRIGERHAKSEAQVAMRWALQKGVVVIPKSSSEKHLSSNLHVFDFELSEQELAEIDGLDEGRRLVNPPFAEF